MLSVVPTVINPNAEGNKARVIVNASFKLSNNERDVVTWLGKLHEYNKNTGLLLLLRRHTPILKPEAVSLHIK